jgi:hypothetical protein
MKWKARLSELGLTEETISHGLRAKIKDYYIIQKGIEKLSSDMQEGKYNDSDMDLAKNDLQELKTDLSDFDDALVKAIETFDKNKDRYAANAKNLKNVKKSGGKVETTTTPTPTSTPTPTPKKEDLPITPTEEVKEGEKKSSSIGWILFAVVAGALTLGAVNLMKNRD